MSLTVACPLRNGETAARKVTFASSMFDDDHRSTEHSVGVFSLGKFSGIAALDSATKPTMEETDGLPDSLMSLTKVRPVQLPSVPTCFICPLGQQIMVDPVIAADGATYERARISEVLRGPFRISPMAQKRLESDELKSNHERKACINAYISLQDSVEAQWKEVENDMARFVNLATYQNEISERKANDLRSHIRALERELCRNSGPSRGSSVSTTASAEEETSIKNDHRTTEFSDKAAGSEDGANCRFQAGPAPKSSRGSMRTPRTNESEVTPRCVATPCRANARFCIGTPGSAGRLKPPLQPNPDGTTPRSQSAWSSIRMALASPRLSSLMRTPR